MIFCPVNHMWKGWVIKESLADTKVLFKTRITNTVLEDNSEGGKKITWTVYTAEIEDSKMYGVSREFEKAIKPAWYTHFTDGKTLIVIFHGKSFRIGITKAGEEKDTGITDFVAKEKKKWQSAFSYGTGKGKVDKRYMLNVK